MSDSGRKFIFFLPFRQTPTINMICWFFPLLLILSAFQSQAVNELTPIKTYTNVPRVIYSVYSTFSFLYVAGDDGIYELSRSNMKLRTVYMAPKCQSLLINSDTLYASCRNMMFQFPIGASSPQSTKQFTWNGAVRLPFNIDTLFVLPADSKVYGHSYQNGSYILPPVSSSTIALQKSTTFNYLQPALNQAIVHDSSSRVSTLLSSSGNKIRRIQVNQNLVVSSNVTLSYSNLLESITSLACDRTSSMANQTKSELD